ncbi:hypothetical protein DFP93_10690 [Aneurinibacillus soli]|uniref:Uncharacterized protein n=1 Tax=Aneurinibacillus soli TaxID=1500254 RepID=A0A0U5B135_9BACL|nr:hypothetical protein [Aneurinibacillus soli]PYE61897.1 hypothetical protein DFP93_10690 [Aneurinibacillus soli]BAU29713.1 hypothetical protein CB4_03950 [Aneurinibacillus soli]
MDDRLRLRRSLFGLSPKKVSAYILKLKHLQEQQLLELQSKVEAQVAEQECLQAEWEELSHKKPTISSYQLFQDLVLKRTQDAIQALQRHTQQELFDLQQQMEQKRAKHEQMIHRIEKQADYYGQVLESQLQEFGSTIQKFHSSSLNLLESDDPSLSDLAASQHEDRPSLFEVSEEEKVTITQLKTVSTSEQQEGPSEFWGSIQPYETIDLVEPELSSAPANVSNLSSDLETFDFFEPKNPQSELKPQDKRTESNEDSKESAALSSEIMSIRNRYIVGKLAGKDLFAQDGRLIIAEKEAITLEIIRLAEQEGKLPDLIVNMRIPSVTEDK